MGYSVFYTQIAEKDLERLDKNIAVRILKKIESYVNSSNPLSYAKKLKNFTIDTYRFRVGDYRIVFRMDPGTNKIIILVVLRVLHRKEVYSKI